LESYVRPTELFKPQYYVTELGRLRPGVLVDIAETVVQITRVSTDSCLIVMQGIRISPQLFSVASIDEKIRSGIPKEHCVLRKALCKRKLNNLRLQLLKN